MASQESNRTFVGVDQSLRSTGVCLLRGGEAELFTIKTGKLREAERLAYIRDTLAESLSEEAITLGAIERGAYNASGRVFQLGGVSAVVQLVLYDQDIPYLIVAPNQLKTHFVGYANAEKDWIQDAAEKELGWRPNDDEADAYALARIARDVYLNRADSRKAAEVVVKLREQGVHDEDRTKGGPDAHD
jgi:Holliday junction resolvasome RuvABC endonuclease subunit